MSDQGQASEGRLAMDTRLLPLTNPSNPPHLPPHKTYTRTPPLPPTEKAQHWEALYFPRSDSPGRTYYQPLIFLVARRVLC